MIVPGPAGKSKLKTRAPATDGKKRIFPAISHRIALAKRRKNGYDIVYRFNTPLFDNFRDRVR